MVPSPSHLLKPATKEVEKVETKPIMNAESENKPSDVSYNIMTTFKSKCSVQDCTFKTDELLPNLATESLDYTTRPTMLCVGHLVDHKTRSWTAQS
jgi:hypothetical protein